MRIPDNHFFDTMTWAALRLQPRLGDLRDRLLSFGGRNVLLWREHNSPEAVEWLLRDGRVYDEPVRILPARVGYCFQNTYLRNKANPELEWLSGFSLFENLWVPHNCSFDTKAAERVDAHTFVERFYGISGGPFRPTLDELPRCPM